MNQDYILVKQNPYGKGYLFLESYAQCDLWKREKRGACWVDIDEAIRLRKKYAKQNIIIVNIDNDMIVDPITKEETIKIDYQKY